MTQKQHEEAYEQWEKDKKAGKNVGMPPLPSNLSPDKPAGDKPELAGAISDERAGLRRRLENLVKREETLKENVNLYEKAVENVLSLKREVEILREETKGLLDKVEQFKFDLIDKTLKKIKRKYIKKKHRNSLYEY